MSGFDCEQQTFLCANVSFGQLIQVCKKSNTNLIMQFGYCEGNIREFFISSPFRNPDITALDRNQKFISYK